MAKINCAISGLTLQVSHVPLTIQTELGYYHPIFALPYKRLFGLYSKHCKGELTATDSYLLFLAFLNATDQVTWKAPCSLDPNDSKTVYLVENNLRQLITVLEMSSAIITPTFKQPSFTVHKDNSQLKQIHNWIAAWEDNIEAFRNNYREQKLQDTLTKLENKLSWYIKSGLSEKEYSFAVANWAEKAAVFPTEKAEYWKKIIRSCFNSERMFSTPLSDIKELKTFCEDNIEAGSIHFHTLTKILKEGITRHTDFLGLPSVGYTLLPANSTKVDEELEAIKATAPSTEPTRSQYDTEVEYIRARLKYNVALRAASKSTTSPESEL